MDRGAAGHVSGMLSADVKRELAATLGESGDFRDLEDTELVKAITRRIPARYRCLKRSFAYLDMIVNLKEPERRGWLARIVGSKHFEGLASFVIVFNAFYMIYAANYEVNHPEKARTYTAKRLEDFFLTFYTLELLLKLIVHRLYFFWNSAMKWNFLDFLLVCYGMIEVALGGANMSWMRSLRLFKAAKVLRVLRVIKSFKELRLILACITGSITSLFWSLVMMAIIFCMFSLIFVQETAGYFKSMGDDLDEQVGSRLAADFGSVHASMLALYAASTGGNDWWVYYDTIGPTGPVSCTLFLFFIAFSQIALVNIITGIFVENAMKLAEPDSQVQAVELQLERQRQEDELRKICNDIDTDGTGTISLKEFQTARKSAKLKNYLDYLGVDVEHTKHLFALLSDEMGQDTVEVDKFVHGIMRMKGGANVIDMQRLVFEVLLSRRTMDATLKEMKHVMHDQQTMIEEHIVSPQASLVRHPKRNTERNITLQTNVCLRPERGANGSFVID